jgi:NAD(P)H dehydrogenase (quinone)
VTFDVSHNMKKILIIQCHPRKDSLCSAFEASYIKGCGGHSRVETIHLRDLRFDPILRGRDASVQPLEPDLLTAQERIAQSQHLVFIYPTWWGSIPALLKGFFDRAFSPGFAFSYRNNSTGWDKLLAGKTARIIATMDSPSWYDRIVYGRSALKQVEKATLAFCGIRTVGCHIHASVRTSSKATREKWLVELENLGKKDGG